MDMDVLADGLAFPEGPAFDSQNTLWCTEGYGGSLVRWDPDVDGFDRIEIGGIPNAIAVDSADNLWICDFEYNAVRRYDPDTGTIDTVVDSVGGEPLDKPNDLAFDAEGNLVFTCSGDPEDNPNAPTQYVCCYRRDGSVEKIAEGLVFPNGLTFVAPDELVVAETYEHRLLKGRWNPESGEWTNVTSWVDVGGPVGPDGMAVNADGNVCVAVFGQGAIKTVDRSGEIADAYQLAGSNPTNVAFDPAGDLGGVVTEVERGEMVSIPELGRGAASIPYIG